MSKSLISCIVPVFNGEKYLAEAIESILKQTYRPLEIIVTDDGSTDGTVRVVGRYGDQIRYVRQSNTGAPAARNRGLIMAEGEFVSFLDSDDLWHPEKLERQMARFDARQELDLCVTYLQNFWIAELEEERARFQHHRLAEPLPGYVSQTLLARRRVFEKVGPFNTDLKLGDPLEWFLRAAENGSAMELLADVLVYRRIHESNLSMERGTRQMTALMQNSVLQVVKASLERRRRQGEKAFLVLNLPNISRSEKELGRQRALAPRIPAFVKNC